MAANTNGPISELVVHDAGLEFTSTDTTTAKTLYTAGANGSRIDSIPCSTNDTAAVNLVFTLQIGGSGTKFYIGVVLVPIGSGYTTVARVEAINTLAPQLGYIPMGAGDVLQVNCLVTMTAAKTTDVMAWGGDF